MLAPQSGDRKLRAAGIVFAALSVQELWGRIFFDLFALPLLRAETAVVGTMLQAVRAGTVWQDNVITGPSGHGIVVYDYCSSFHNLSLAALCWVTVRSLQDQGWQVRDFVIGCVVGMTMVLFNVTKLCLMAWDANLYHYWHDGAGVQIFNIGGKVTPAINRLPYTNCYPIMTLRLRQVLTTHEEHVLAEAGRMS